MNSPLNGLNRIIGAAPWLWIGSENEVTGVDVVHDAGPRLRLEPAGAHIGQRCMRSCSGLERGKCAMRYSIWSARTRRPFKKMYSA